MTGSPDAAQLAGKPIQQPCGMIGAAANFAAPAPPPMDLPLFTLPPQDQRRWLVEQLSRPPPPAALQLSDGYRLPGREGEARPAAVLVPIVNRPDGLPSCSRSEAPISSIMPGR